MAAIRRPVRSRPIRLYLITMFAVPLVSLVGLWAFAASVTVPRAISDHQYTVSSSALSGPAVTTLSVDLPAERQQTYLWLLSGKTTSNAALLATRAAISKVLPAVRAAYQQDGSGLSASAEAESGALLAQLAQLGRIRAQADAGNLSPSAAFSAYSAVIDAEFRFYDASIEGRGGSLQGISVGASDAAYSLEMASREVALADGALTVGQGKMSAAVRQLFTASAANRQQLFNETIALLTGDLDSGYVAIAHSAAYQQFQAMEAQISASAGDKPLPVNAKDWESVSGTVLQAMTTTEEANGVRLKALGSSETSGLLTEAILAGGVGLAAVIVSLFLLIWFGRKVTGDLTGLHSSVRGMAEERLPRVVERLRRGDDVDVLAESPPPASSGIAEISQVARSFGIVLEAAVAAAVEQARLRKGVNQVFLNISMRNQSLLHRQLGMLDSMERRTSEPGALADLFRLDHLTTRMRRHAEGLIILSGSTPGRGWREPVPVVDVLRAAVAEVEDYVRVDVLSESRDLVAGNAVNDVIHLVAELVENAAAFSPPNTRIEVRADRAGTGLVVEVEDRGLGLTDDELADINRRLARPPEFDLANSEQLGLYVVSRLAVRHAIKVSLRQSAYGGTTAILLLPFGVIVREEDADAPAGPGALAGAAPAAELHSAAAGADGPDPAASGPPLSPFGATGRHRLPAAATGRRADTAPVSRNDEAGPPAPRPIPRPPWEYADDDAPSGPPQPGREPAAAAANPASRPPWYVEVDPARPWPHAFNRNADSPGPARPAEDPLSAAPADPFAAGPAAAGSPAGPAALGSHLGMPIRVPQANLVPQLQSRRDSGQPPAGSAPAEIDERPPEATRNMMLMMQQGWERGRADDLDDPAGAADNETQR